jgi:hypothetical protein
MKEFEAGRVPRVRKIRNTQKVIAGIEQGKILRGRSKHRWKGNIKNIGCGLDCLRIG